MVDNANGHHWKSLFPNQFLTPIKAFLLFLSMESNMAECHRVEDQEYKKSTLYHRFFPKHALRCAVQDWKNRKWLDTETVPQKSVVSIFICGNGIELAEPYNQIISIVQKGLQTVTKRFWSFSLKWIIITRLPNYWWSPLETVRSM